MVIPSRRYHHGSSTGNYDNHRDQSATRPTRWLLDTHDPPELVRDPYPSCIPIIYPGTKVSAICITRDKERTAVVGPTTSIECLQRGTMLILADRGRRARGGRWKQSWSTSEPFIFLSVRYIVPGEIVGAYSIDERGT